MIDGCFITYCREVLAPAEVQLSPNLRMCWLHLAYEEARVDGVRYFIEYDEQGVTKIAGTMFSTRAFAEHIAAQSRESRTETPHTNVRVTRWVRDPTFGVTPSDPPAGRSV